MSKVYTDKWIDKNGVTRYFQDADATTKLSGIEDGAQKNTIESISVNNQPVSPDINKNINVTIPAAPVQSVSKNNVALTPDINGNVDITVPTGAAADKGFTTTVTENSADLVTSGGVYTAVHATKPVTEGGTGATTAADARTNLGLGAAALKEVDTTIGNGSESVNLPTSAAVASFVENKGYLTSVPVTSVNGQTGAVNITAVSFHVLNAGEDLPAIGVPGGFYFKPNGAASGTNIYNEWIDTTGQGNWECLGPIEVDLSNYTQFSNIVVPYDATETYDLLRMVSYNNNFYLCVAEVTEPEPFDSAKWVQIESYHNGISEILSQIIVVTAGGDYSSSTEYEKLTIVNYQGGSYMSLQTTEGNLPTNTNYWMKLGENNKQTIIANKTLLASGWDSTTNVYSFETEYPSTNYNLIGVYPQENATDDQRKALSKADIGGYYSTNIAKAHGTVPTIDIPVVLEIVEK